MARKILLACVLSLLCLGLGAKGKSKGAIGKTTEQGGVTVSVQFYAPTIVRVVKHPSEADASKKKSYSVVLTPDARQLAAAVRVEERGQTTVLSSDYMTVTLDGTTGRVTFADAQGEVLLQEKAAAFDMLHDGADAGKYRVAQSWLVGKDEMLFGLGQLRDTSMNWRGRSIEIWNHNTYTSIPYFTSERGYGVYWDNAGRSWFKDSADEGTSFSSEVATCADYYFIYRDGTQDGVVAGIRQLTGQATMFPLWTMGHWQCRERYKTSDELAAVLDKYRELHIPLDGIVQDWQYWGCDSNWNAMRFQNPYYINKVGDAAWEKYLPDDLKRLAAEHKASGREPRLKSPQAMVDYVHEQNAHLMISIWANFGPWTEPYRELKAIGALLPFDTWPRQKGVMPYDPFNPAARDIYWKHLTHLYSMGFDAWWTDSTEPDHFEQPGDDDVMTHDGTWRSVKNAFPLMTNRGIYEHQRAAEKLKMKRNKSYKGRRSVQMTRSGAFGIQHYGTFSWSGDIVASWDEMKNQIPSGLNYTLCGIPFWNTDLGGFFYWEFEQDPKNPAIQELQTRWMQWGTFMPLMRNHCSSPMVSELYEFRQPGDWAYDAMLEAVRLRYRLLPYIYSTAGDVVQGSGSMMRPLVMDFASDRKAIALNDEYLFGRSLLVKPVTDPMFTWRDDNKKGHQTYPDVRQAAAPVRVYLPAASLKKGDGETACKWYDFHTGQCYEGGRSILRPCTINEIPVFVKAGTVLPIGPDVQYSSELPWDDLELRVYPGADGTFTLYEDEGDNYNYERGAFTLIGFHWNDALRTLTITDRHGSYKGMLQQRQFRVRLMVPGEAQEAHAVAYDGKRLTVKL